MLIGVTGNIGAGKSLFCSFLRELTAAPVVNADELGKRLLKKGEAAYEPVVRTFGEGILNEDGEIVPAKLAKLVFSDPKELQKLTSITHPLIAERIEQLGRSHPLVFVEAAVLIEANWHGLFDAVVLVFAYKGQRLLRAARRFGLKEAVRRDALQLPYGEKLKYADYLVCNVKTPLHLKEQAYALIQELEAV